MGDRKCVHSVVVNSGVLTGGGIRNLNKKGINYYNFFYEILYLIYQI